MLSKSSSSEKVYNLSRIRQLEEEVSRLRAQIQSHSEKEKEPLSAREALLVEAEKIAHMGSWSWNTKTDEVKWSDELFCIVGLEPGSFSPTVEKFMECVHPDDRAYLQGLVPVAKKEQSPRKTCIRILRPNSEVREVIMEGSSVFDEEDQLVRMVGTVLDVTEIREKERKLEKSEKILRESQRIAKLANWVLDVKLNELEFSKGSYSPFPGRHKFKLSELKELLNPSDLRKLRKIKERGIAGQPCETQEIQISIPGQPAKHVLLETFPIPGNLGEETWKLHGTLLDITEFKVLEDQLYLAQKMEAVGLLAGGVAHDFNNLLTVILGNTSLLRKKQNPDYLDQIKNAADFGAALTQQLLAFSRRTSMKATVLDLNTVVRDTGELLNRLIGDNIRLKLKLHSSAVPVFANKAQLQQILMNLAVNARDAMLDGGELGFKLNTTTFENISEKNSGMPDGSYALVEVSDNGKGMTRETINKIYDPFFTTKGKGKGTGLGLSAVKGILKQYKGVISVSSQAGKGTCFSIYLPLSSEPITEILSFSHDGTGGSETILVVEDNPDVRQVVIEFLSNAGYSVLEAPHPKEAMRIWEEKKAEIKLVITDLLMPDHSGMELANYLLGNNPHLQILFVSGYLPETNGQFSLENYLQKPFYQNDLLGRVRNLLNKTT